MALLTAYCADLDEACRWCEKKPADGDPPTGTKPTATEFTEDWYGVVARIYRRLKAVGLTVDTSAANDARKEAARVEAYLTSAEFLAALDARAEGDNSKEAARLRKRGEELLAEIIAAPYEFSLNDGATLDTDSVRDVDYGFVDEEDDFPSDNDPDPTIYLDMDM